MLDNHNNNNNIEESVIAKSTGQQEEKDVAVKDTALYNVSNSKKKMTKSEAGYREQEKNEKVANNYNNNYDNNNKACIKCKFNLPNEKNVIL
ncbi:MAG: hypothetical protein ACJ73C_13120 [Nitrososphaeraceae archaeon]